MGVFQDESLSLVSDVLSSALGAGFPRVSLVGLSQAVTLRHSTDARSMGHSIWILNGWGGGLSHLVNIFGAYIQIRLKPLYKNKGGFIHLEKSI